MLANLDRELSRRFPLGVAQETTQLVAEPVLGKQQPNLFIQRTQRIDRTQPLGRIPRLALLNLQKTKAVAKASKTSPQESKLHHRTLVVVAAQVPVHVLHRVLQDKVRLAAPRAVPPRAAREMDLCAVRPSGLQRGQRGVLRVLRPRKSGCRAPEPSQLYGLHRAARRGAVV